MAGSGYRRNRLDEMPLEAWDRMWEQDIHFYEEEYTYDEQFYDHIQIGIWVAGKTVSFLNPEHAREKYKEYERLYEDKCRERYIPDYYEKNHIFQADEAYCKRIFESYGLDEKRSGKVWGISFCREKEYGLKWEEGK